MLSIDETLYQLGNRSDSRSLRQSLDVRTAKLELREETFPLSVVTYNLALMPTVPTDVYKGTDRAGCVAEVIQRTSGPAHRPATARVGRVFATRATMLSRAGTSSTLRFARSFARTANPA